FLHFLQRIICGKYAAVPSVSDLASLLTESIKTAIRYQLFVGNQENQSRRPRRNWPPLIQVIALIFLQCIAPLYGMRALRALFVCRCGCGAQMDMARRRRWYREFTSLKRCSALAAATDLTSHSPVIKRIYRQYIAGQYACRF
ncbi:TPA: hypothetical protein QDB01_006369, partial [Burkholderia vietnamiensis]|nr:hypothetical protein [Burkholderia vietnamiensis]